MGHKAEKAFFALIRFKFMDRGPGVGEMGEGDQKV